MLHSDRCGALRYQKRRSQLKFKKEISRKESNHACASSWSLIAQSAMAGSTQDQRPAKPENCKSRGCSSPWGELPAASCSAHWGSAAAAHRSAGALMPLAGLVQTAAAPRQTAQLARHSAPGTAAWAAWAGPLVRTPGVAVHQCCNKTGVGQGESVLTAAV